MAEILKLEFCKVHIENGYMIVIVDEGQMIDIEKSDILEAVAQDYFKGNPFVYITHRINSYGVDPNVYKSVSQIKNLLGFCVVSSNYMAKSNAMIEKLFLNKPFEVFDHLDEAKEWADSLAV
ncbi:hypothetical protein [Sediminibacter sp. Hel_I_10]|uniref:hypothetical protein n=1 Tax=Sediminibacter sp. Hel_I_10 TaxID=1392490 RepID=UPI000479FA70|nr:hypothetical protein [Sediminibacter sp. Hel_I_10]